MNNSDLQKTIERYNKRLDELGYSEEALGWTRRNATTRFEYLIIEWEKELNNATVCDFGCGFGDLLTYMKGKGLSDVKYTGIDINQRLTEIGKEQHPDADFWVGDILTDEFDRQFDFSFSSGVFNHKLEGIDEYEFIKRSLDKLNEISTKGFAVNFLSDKVEYNTDHNFNSSPARILDMCYAYSNNVVLRNDYMPFEFTVYVRKDRSIDRDKLIYING